MSRAVARAVALMGGPYQGTRVPGGSARRAAWRRARAARHRSRSASGGSAARASAPSSTNVSGAAAASATWAANAAGSVAASSAASSVHARCAIWWATLQRGAGVGAVHRPGGSAATSRSRASLSSRRSSRTPPGARAGSDTDTVCSPPGRDTSACGGEHGSGDRNNQACLLELARIDRTGATTGAGPAAGLRYRRPVQGPTADGGAGGRCGARLGRHHLRPAGDPSRRAAPPTADGDTDDWCGARPGRHHLLPTRGPHRRAAPAAGTGPVRDDDTDGRREAHTGGDMTADGSPPGTTPSAASAWRAPGDAVNGRCGARP